MESENYLHRAGLKSTSTRKKTVYILIVASTERQTGILKSCRKYRWFLITLRQFFETLPLTCWDWKSRTTLFVLRSLHKMDFNHVSWNPLTKPKRPVHVLLSRFYLDFILILSRLYPNLIQIFQKLTLSWFLKKNLDKIWKYLDKVGKNTLSRFYPDFSETHFIQISIKSG